jgi:RNA polymerase sigma factor (sigma-70 family)
MGTAPLGTLLRHLEQATADHGARQGTDRELLDDFAGRGSEAAFAALVSRHGPMVLRAARRVLRHEQDAEDAFQATFLVLARNAASIRKREALASCLHGVAYRTAMKAKRSAARRRDHEARLRAVTPPAPGPTWDEVQAVLDEEVQQLPACFREAFVLCVLEGKSTADAAAELGVKEGTVKSRVNRARRALQRQLDRRGIKLAALLAALSVAESASRGAVPAGLSRAAIRLGPLVAAGEPAAGAIPPHVAALAAGVTRAMSTSKLKVATAVLLAVGLVAAGAGTLARQGVAAGERPAESPRAADPKPAAAKPAGDQGDLAFAGRVLGPDGRPVAGAKLFLTLSWSYVKRPAPSPVRATTGEDGRFQFTVPKAKYGEHVTAVVATAPGCGPAWVEVNPDAAKDKLELRLVKDDVPLAGRVVDLQGRPVGGATVRALQLLASPKEDLGPWLEALRGRQEGSHQLERQHLPRQLLVPEIPGLPHAATTDADGRFRLTGIGRERVVALQIEGPTIATRQVRAMTRAGETALAPEWKTERGPGRTRPTLLAHYGATFTHAAAPTKPVVGVVRDKDTSQPLAGVTVQSYKLAHDPMHGRDFIQTKTDALGRYRLTGLPKGPDNKIIVVPRDDQPYVTVHAVVPDTDALTPVTVDFALKRGVWVEGKISDKVTGKPAGRYVQLSYYSMYNNPNLRDYPGFEHVHFGRPTNLDRVKEDGSYRVVGLPGPGLLAVQYTDRYLLATERDGPEGTREPFLNTAPFAVSGISYNALTPVNPPKGADSFRRDVTLDPGWSFKGTVLGPDDKPLAGARPFGLSGWGGWQHGPLKTAEFTVHAFNPHRPRDLLFQHREEGLVGVAQPPKANGGAVTVRLERGATVTGRLVDADGQPRAGAELNLTFRRKGGMMWHGFSPERVRTDGEGRFRIEALLSGCEYRLDDHQGYRALRDSLRPGETKDLGDVRLKGAGE